MTDVARAVRALQSGGLVAFPTETVYGLGADSAQPDAVQRIFTVKCRPPGRPLTLHIGRHADPNTWSHWTEQAQALAERFWPGPLTLVLPRRDVADIITGGLDTVGLRMPNHPLTLELLDRFGGAVPAPSANRSGQISPTTAQHVLADLGDQVDVILDGGPCNVGLESTVLSLVHTPTILRQGAIPLQDLSQTVGPIQRAEIARSARQGPPIALRSSQVLVASPLPSGTGLLWWGQGAPEAELSIQLPDDPAGFANQVWAALRELQDRGAQRIWIRQLPSSPPWDALRLRIQGLTDDPP